MTHRTESINVLLPHRRDKMLSSVAIRPEMEFETQNPNETVSILLRKHFFTNIGWILITIILSFVPIILVVLFSFVDFKLTDIPFFKVSYLVIGLMLWYLVVFTFTFMRFLDWYFNIYLITNERVLDFDFNPFAYHKISETGLDSIVDATQEVIGFLPMLFNYGDVFIQTAGERREFDFRAVPNPAWVRDKIMDLRDIVVS